MNQPADAIFGLTAASGRIDASALGNRPSRSVFSIVTAAKAPSVPESFMRIFNVILISCFFLASCETIKGVGRDVEDAGEKIDDSIDDE